MICQTTSTDRAGRSPPRPDPARNPEADIRFIDTVCLPTKEHQRALERLIDQVDAVVVVGGRNSNNTRALAERARERGRPTVHVQGPADLDPFWFRPEWTVGLTAGTSTLDATIASVHMALLTIAGAAGGRGGGFMTLEPSKAPTSRRVPLLVGSTLVLLLAVGLFFAQGRERVIALGRPQRFDDFAFAVANVHRLDAIDGFAPSAGSFLVVRLGIRNQAKRVDYQFRPGTAFVEDADGVRYPLSTEATRRRAGFAPAGCRLAIGRSRRDRHARPTSSSTSRPASAHRASCSLRGRSATSLIGSSKARSASRSMTSRDLIELTVRV